MRERIPRERLQPSLLDRLTDDAPEQALESREQRVLSMRRLRECVLRDLLFLFNAGKLLHGRKWETGRGQERQLPGVNLEEVPLVSHSVVNYGLPDLAGKTASGVDPRELEEILKQAIQDFEPRLLADSVSVRALPRAEQLQRQNKLVFVIQAKLWTQQLPEDLFLRTEIDLEIGEVRLLDPA